MFVLSVGLEVLAMARFDSVMVFVAVREVCGGNEAKVRREFDL